MRSDAKRFVDDFDLTVIRGKTEKGRSSAVIQARLESFEQFWPHYLGEHLNPLNRVLHFIGTSLVYVFLAGGIVQSPRWFLLAPLVGYGFAWVGHFFVERNRPATFSYPFWSLRGDFRMHFRMLTGRLGKDLGRPEVGAAEQIRRLSTGRDSVGQTGTESGSQTF